MTGAGIGLGMTLLGKIRMEDFFSLGSEALATTDLGRKRHRVDNIE
jgi:hypothetical protein